MLLSKISISTPFFWGDDPIWLAHIFQMGGSTTNELPFPNMKPDQPKAPSDQWKTSIHHRRMGSLRPYRQRSWNSMVRRIFWCFVFFLGGLWLKKIDVKMAQGHIRRYSHWWVLHRFTSFLRRTIFRMEEIWAMRSLDFIVSIDWRVPEF